MPSVSVIINCHNYRDYVAEAVQSALDQTRRPDQIVIVDDGSTDGSGELLASKFGHIPGIEIVRQRNGGQLSAMVAGFQRATGDVFFLLDADDRYQPGHIQGVMGVYESRKDVDFVFTGVQEFGQRSHPQLFHPRDHYLSSSVIRSFNNEEWTGAPTSALSFRRHVAEALLPVLRDLAPQWRIRADDCVVRGASAAGARKYFLAVTSVDYRIHGANSWAAKDESDAVGWQHKIRTLCFIQRLHTHLGLAPAILRWTHKEFVMMPEPRQADYDAYRAIVKSASHLSWRVKLRMYWRMRQHFRQHGQKDERIAR